MTNLGKGLTRVIDQKRHDGKTAARRGDAACCCGAAARAEAELARGAAGRLHVALVHVVNADALRSSTATRFAPLNDLCPSAFVQQGLGRQADALPH